MTLNFSRRHHLGSSGSALLISLTMIVLITVVILVFTVQTKLDRQLSALNWEDEQARNIAQIGLDSALMLIRETLEPYDDPFGSTTSPTTFWSLSPGRIDRFDFRPNGAGRPYRSGIVELHSGYPVADTNDAADLNAPDSFGQRPIWSENRSMQVDWKLVGRNPSEPLSADNPIVGRFAFWVDDEGSKINVNTADGSDNYTLLSYGQGTPTAVSLSVFRDLGDGLAPGQATVRLIAAEGRRKPFATLSEMATRPALTNATNGVTPKFPSTNAFNLTTYSRSPDFNLFNLPKFQLIPSNVDSLSQLAGSLNFVPINRMIQYTQIGNFYRNETVAAKSALRSLYPTPRQLTNAWTNVWPLMPNYPAMDGGVQLVTSVQKMTNAGGNFSVNQVPRFEAMRQMALYLVGTNALGRSIRWPFADPNYLAKYNLRQIDSIALQIFEMPRNAAMRNGGEDNKDSMINPSILPYGLLSNKPVGSAVGRYPRLTRVLAKVSLTPRVPALLKLTATSYYPGIEVYTTNNPPPPGRNLGDPTPAAVGYYDGANFRMNVAVSQYLPRQLYDSDNMVDGQIIDRSSQWSQVWLTVGHLGWSGYGGLNEMDGAMEYHSLLNPATRWMDTLMYAEANFGSGFVPGNSSGIDFRANPAHQPDPDPRAAAMRWPEYKELVGSYGGPNWGAYFAASGFQIWATGDIAPHWTGNPWYTSYNDQPLFKSVAFGPNPYYEPQVGLSQNFSFDGLNRDFKTRNRLPAGSHPNGILAIRLRGGITLQVREQARMALSPLDAILGPLNSAWSSQVVTNSPTTISNLSKAVVPLFTPQGMELAIGQTKYVVAKLRDPMVGQLPGDWLVKHHTFIPGPTQTSLAEIFWNDYGVHTWPRNAYEGNATQFDYLPEPEWVDMAAESGAVALQVSTVTNDVVFRPYMEGNVQKIQQVNLGTTDRLINLARQKSFPSVGHLQYVRTGAMPDNTNAQSGDADYAGMPFRCLNFGPANTQGGIPDWALLDLFVVPNAIWTLPSSRFAYPAIDYNEANRPELINLTYGGASSGKINLNGAVLWPWAATDTNFVRPMPLAAQFNGLRYNQDGKVYRQLAKSLTIMPPVPTFPVHTRVHTSTNSWKVMNGEAAKTLAGAIAAYLRTNGPLALSGQMSDIPAVNAYGAQIPTTLNGETLLPPNTGFYGPGNSSPDGLNRTRNDIVSQSIGNLTVQGNVFAVWVVGQSIRKSATSDPETFESTNGDRVIAQSRLRFLVERKLDPGVDGVYGNSDSGGAGLDGVIGTPDDDVSVNSHPANPKFIYQVIDVSAVE